MSTSQGAPEAGAWAEAKATALWAIQRWQRTMAPQELTDAIFDAPAVRALAASPSPPPGVGKPGALVATDQRAEANEAPGAASPVGVEVVKLRPLPAIGDEAEKYVAARGPEWSAVFNTLRDYRMSNMVYEGDNDPYCLVDLMSRDHESGNGQIVTIADGEWEMVQLTDEIMSALVPSSLLKEAEEALAKLLNRYVGLVNCGDCGHWNPEDEAEVKEARSILARLGAAP